MRYAFLALVLVWGCGDDSATPDGGADASVDVGLDTASDVGLDALDAGTGLDWVPCRTDRGECATLTVPLDYADESLGTMALPVFRLPALADRIGVLFVASGAGGSGADLVEQLPGFGTPGLGDVLRRFDIVGLDVRGNGSSEPSLGCYADSAARINALATIRSAIPDDDAVATEALDILDTCREASGTDLRYFSTAFRVQDIERLRTLLGEDELSLLGVSYGTWTSTAYALAYPDRVRAAALFSALPIQELFDRVESNARGVDAALTGFLEWCDATMDCAFKPVAGTTRERFDTLATTLDEEERRVVGSIVDDLLWMMRGRTVVREYGEIADVLVAAETDPSALPELMISDSVERSFLEHVLDLTVPGDASYADWRARATTIRSELVSWGPFVSDWDPRVVFGVAWDQPRDTVMLEAIPEAPPFLFIAGDLDPITPVEGAIELATALGNDSVILDAQIVGHGTLARNPCALARSADYLLDPSSLAGSPTMIACPEIAPDETVIGTVSDTFLWRDEFDSRVVETPIGNLVADSMRAEAETQLAFINGGGIRTTLPAAAVTPADMTLRRPQVGYAAGPPYDIVVDDVRAVLPFGNRVITVEVTGERLWAFLEETLARYDGEGGPALVQISGFTLSFDADGVAGSRVLSVMLDGSEPIANDASTTYSLATVDFVYYGGTDIVSLIDLPATFGRTVDEALVDYIIDNSGTPGTDLVPATDGRIDIQ